MNNLFGSIVEVIKLGEWASGIAGFILAVSYSQIWCMGIKQLSCLIAPLLVRRLGISRC